MRMAGSAPFRPIPSPNPNPNRLTLTHWATWDWAKWEDTA